MMDASQDSIFAAELRPFPDPVDGKISTVPFLEAAAGVVKLVELLGQVFAPVRYDINGNIQKLTAKYNEDEKRFEFLNDMLLFEKAQGCKATAIDALLWLRRALHFVHNFLRSVATECRDNNWGEDLSTNVQTSYRETLEMHHGWIAQKLFGVLSKMIPKRSQLIKAFALSKEEEVTEEKKQVIIEELERFLVVLNTNLTVLSKFYDDFKLMPGNAKCA
ncbi:glycolipid transfer protein [Thrips palmi]|uniref:Glycolipid transfer protein n=1 Tax=Thrips palmi TaxID=161013 RepID=A0A6P9A2M3_THRPL|nr:glycolipid transfer protein [Thrips palmi]